MDIITRADAKIQGLPRFFEARICARGHCVEHYTHSGKCSECAKLTNQAFRDRDREAHNARSKAWRKANPEKERASELKRRQRHAPVLKARMKRYYENNKAKFIESARAREQSIVVRSFKHEAKEINLIYKNCPEGHEVDHEIPLKHELVCGLHCVANLQYLTQEANRKKSNLWSPE